MNVVPRRDDRSAEPVSIGRGRFTKSVRMGPFI